MRHDKDYIFKRMLDISERSIRILWLNFTYKFAYLVTGHAITASFSAYYKTNAPFANLGRHWWQHMLVADIHIYIHVLLAKSSCNSLR